VRSGGVRGFLFEAAGLFAEALVERLIALDADTRLHNAVPFHGGKAERKFGSFGPLKIVGCNLLPKLTKRESIF
jgi:hypothetical protein